MLKLLFWLVILGLPALIWAYFIEPNFLSVKKYRLKQPGLEGLKIVFASDFHATPHDEKRLEKISLEIMAQKGDIILLGGDFMNGHKPKSSLSASKIASALNALRAPLGVYAVLGNHDWWIDGLGLAAELEKHNIRVLGNEHLKLSWQDKFFYLAGVEDYITRQCLPDEAIKEAKNPLLLLSHSPDIFPKVSSRVDLTLAGHTHGGQIVAPFWGAIFVPSEHGKRYESGLIVEDGKKILVTKGLGMSLMPIRFNCHPEIVVIDFY